MDQEIKVIDKRGTSEALMVQDTTPNGLLAMAISKGFGVEQLEKFMDFAERYEKNQARKAFFAAMAAFKSEEIELFKVAGAESRFDHADLGESIRAVSPLLAKYDLFANWKLSQPDGLVSVECVVTHKDGHSESTGLRSAPDASGGKNGIQAIGSAVKYLERYTFFAATGLAPLEKDDDGEGTAVEYISPEQAATIKLWIDKCPTLDQPGFFKYCGAYSIETIQVPMFDEAIRVLKLKAGAKE